MDKKTILKKFFTTFFQKTWKNLPDEYKKLAENEQRFIEEGFKQNPKIREAYAETSERTIENIFEKKCDEITDDDIANLLDDHLVDMAMPIKLTNYKTNETIQIILQP